MECIETKQDINTLLMLKQPLPEKAPIGMEEAMIEDSISISYQQSVSDQPSPKSVSSDKDDVEIEEVQENANKPEVRVSQKNVQPFHEEAEEDIPNPIEELEENLPPKDVLEEDKEVDKEPPEIHINKAEDSPKLMKDTQQEIEAKVLSDRIPDHDAHINSMSQSVNQRPRRKSCELQMQEITEQIEDEEDGDNSPAVNRAIEDAASREQSSSNEEDSEGEESESSSESSEEEKKEFSEDPEFDRANAIRLEKPFYEVDESQRVDIERTASFGEPQDLLRCMPSFAKFGLLSHGALAKHKKGGRQDANGVEEAKQPPREQAHEVGPEYLSIDPALNLQAGFFYLAREAEKAAFEK